MGHPVIGLLEWWCVDATNARYPELFDMKGNGTTFYFKYVSQLPIDVVLEVISETVIEITFIYALPEVEDEDMAEDAFFTRLAPHFGYIYDDHLREFVFVCRWPYYPVALSFETKMVYICRRICRFAAAVRSILGSYRPPA